MAATVVSDGTSIIKKCWSCAKCLQLVYCDDWYNPDHVGACPAGDNHEAGCSELKVVDTGEGESGYKFCRCCSSVYLATSAVSGKCSGGTAHTPGEVTMTLKSEKRDKNVTYSFGWSRCKKCACLYQNGYSSNGPCFKGGNHELAGNLVYYCTQPLNNY